MAHPLSGDGDARLVRFPALERRTRGSSNFRQRDLQCVAQAMRKAGVGRYRVECERGKVIVIVGEEEARLAALEQAEADEWEGAEAL